jgi:putative membrane protein
MFHHVQFMAELRETRKEMVNDKLIYRRSTFPISFTFLVALALLLMGLLAIASMVFNVGLFR